MPRFLATEKRTWEFEAKNIEQAVKFIEVFKTDEATIHQGTKIVQALPLGVPYKEYGKEDEPMEVTQE